MTTLSMLANLVVVEEKTLGEGKKISQYLKKIGKGQKLTITEFNFTLKLFNKYLGGK
jgi:hypothetical protein